MPHSNVDRKRRFSDIQDTYVSPYADMNLYLGPEQFVESGSRGFLVTTKVLQEEFAVDDAIVLLRQAAIKLTGGIKAGKKTDVDKSPYVRIDFTDPKNITHLPNPDGEEEEEEEEEEKKKKEDAEKNENTEDKKDEEKKESEKMESNENETATDDKKEVGDEKKAKDEVEEEPSEKPMEESNVDDKEEGQKDEQQLNQEAQKEKETEVSEKNGDKDETTEAKSNDEKSSGKNKDGKEKKGFIYMTCTYKFSAFRTEIRNVMFIKSDYPDPCELAKAAMDLIIERRRTTMPEAILQVLPAVGVCDFDLFQLEVMSRRVLSPFFDENLPPKSVSMMLHDKLAEPGSLNILEVIRNTIWSINPCTEQASPLTEPDLAIRLEVVGSKLILCCMPDFIKYRQYSPTLVGMFGVGEPEDDDLTYISTEQRKQIAERKERKRKQEEERKVREEAKRLKREQEAKERKERRAAEEARRAEERKKREAEREKKAEEEAARKKKAEEEAEQKKKAEEEGETKKAEEEGETKKAEEKEDEKIDTDEQSEKPDEALLIEPGSEVKEDQEKVVEDKSKETEDKPEEMEVDEKPAAKKKSRKSTEEQVSEQPSETAAVDEAETTVTEEVPTPTKSPRSRRGRKPRK